MANFDRVNGSWTMGSALLFCVAAALAVACTGPSRPAVQVASSRPTVSYVYGDDQALVDALGKAEVYCAEYNAWPTALGSERRSDGRHITFACDQPRTVATGTVPARTVVVSPGPTPVDYPYRDDGGLIDALNQAQRYCRGYNATPRSTRVVNHADGTRTVSFACERS
jgi:hypothetical protein